MEFPQRVGITEIYVGEPKFSVAYLDAVVKETKSYFPVGFLEITPLENLPIDNNIIAKKDAFSLLAKLRKEKSLDMAGGLSFEVYYLDKKRQNNRVTGKKEEVDVIEKINEANIEEKVFICGNERPPKATMPRILAQEIGHELGLGHETPSIF